MCHGEAGAPETAPHHRNGNNGVSQQKWKSCACHDMCGALRVACGVVRDMYTRFALLCVCVVFSFRQTLCFENSRLVGIYRRIYRVRVERAGLISNMLLGPWIYFSAAFRSHAVSDSWCFGVPRATRYPMDGWDDWWMANCAILWWMVSSATSTSATPYPVYTYIYICIWKERLCTPFSTPNEWRVFFLVFDRAGVVQVTNIPCPFPAPLC